MLYDFENTEICHRHQSHKSTIAAPPHMFFTILKSQSLAKGSVQPFPQAERSLDGICFFDTCHTFQPIKSQGIARNSCQRAMK